MKNKDGGKTILSCLVSYIILIAFNINFLNLFFSVYKIVYSTYTYMRQKSKHMSISDGFYIGHLYSNYEIIYIFLGDKKWACVVVLIQVFLVNSNVTGVLGNSSCFLDSPYLLRCKLIGIIKYLENFPESYFTKHVQFKLN